MNIPPMAWVILALGVIWLLLRVWQQKQAAERAEARDARIAALLAEREKLQGEEPPGSLGAVTSGPASTAEARCLGCKTVNPPGAKTCAGCGLEL